MYDCLVWGHDRTIKEAHGQPWHSTVVPRILDRGWTHSPRECGGRKLGL